MRARQLEVFTAVMRAGTVTGAARLLNTSQPALSQILAHAEDELGFALFERVKGRLRPTPEAVELYPEAERLFAGLEGLRRKTDDLRVGRAGLVRIAASPPPALALLPQSMMAYRESHPEVLIRSHVAPIATMIDMLRGGDAVLAIALDDTLPPDIAVEPLGNTSMCCLLPPGHRFESLDRVSFADLESETLISYRKLTRPGEELAVAAGADGAAFDVGVEIDGSIGALGLVAAGVGVGVVDSMLPWQHFAGLERRPLAAEVVLPVSLLTLRGKTLSRAEAAMAEEIRRTARTLL
ncbi:DNA-binding transcriptional regulator, LysR family [Roseivivax sediminis]|uniref:DNA-binding transcriptional regulator, LysR family n=2 Tax=Roseivivax sediminis TaxID=936889 RepID=A0A1I1T9Z3_9RHOB|nr:DNA-binding transcriptional regulator, LysR family [Roseivivax sediminis]